MSIYIYRDAWAVVGERLFIYGVFRLATAAALLALKSIGVFVTTRVVPKESDEMTQSSILLLQAEKEAGALLLLLSLFSTRIDRCLYVC